MKIYVASSWRNAHQPGVVQALRAAGHEVYDFRNPHLGNVDHGFSWSEIDPAWQQWSAAKYREALEHPVARAGLAADFEGMRWADACVAVQPYGRSASLELGWAIGAGKISLVLLAEGQEPELMPGLADRLCLTVDEIIEWLPRVAQQRDDRRNDLGDAIGSLHDQIDGLEDSIALAIDLLAAGDHAAAGKQLADAIDIRVGDAEPREAT